MRISTYCFEIGDTIDVELSVGKPFVSSVYSRDEEGWNKCSKEVFIDPQDGELYMLTWYEGKDCDGRYEEYCEYKMTDKGWVRIASTSYDQFAEMMGY